MALLNRVLQRAPRKPAQVEEARMTIIEHLEALRRALIVSLAAWGIATVASFFISGRVIGLLIQRAWGGVRGATIG